MSPGPKKRRKIDKPSSKKGEIITKKKKSLKKSDDEVGTLNKTINEELKASAVIESDEMTGYISEIKSDDPYMNAETMKRERHALSKGFKVAKKFFCKRGPWTLPPEVGDNRFTAVAKLTLAKMVKCDRFDVFTEAVTEDEAPGYYNIIKYPMDFSKMKNKIEEGIYGSGSRAAAAFYEDFLLVFENCFLYNDDEGDVVEEAARLFALLPETYALACTAIASKKNKISAIKR